MLFKTLTLPNRLSLNLFSGNLVINIFIFPLLDHLLTQLVCYSFIIILIYEINNGSLQLFIFSLLSNKLLSIRYLLVTSFLARKEGSNPKGTFSKVPLDY